MHDRQLEDQEKPEAWGELTAEDTHQLIVAALARCHAMSAKIRRDSYVSPERRRIPMSRAA